MFKKAKDEIKDDPYYIEKRFADSSEDEAKWEMEDPAPLVNIVTFGWMEGIKFIQSVKLNIVFSIAYLPL
jgi:hypothetical protein